LNIDIWDRSGRGRYRHIAVSWRVELVAAKLAAVRQGQIRRWSSACRRATWSRTWGRFRPGA